MTDCRAEIKRLPKKTGESGAITSNIEKNTVVSDSEESSKDSDDEEINQESEKDGENKQVTKKDESRSENSKLINETDENLYADLIQIIDPGVVHEQNAGSIKEDGHKVYDSTNTEP
ncbi:hypothetical protein KQX54_013231 [Cotesia glomerata]|uniref:Uncharacterized protein n=1 Tax=Cotesia glomerata TaxID=32391 RepID=A0AAV7IF69_COTGL|nr:hypothetical protein KQX54_013231 [Cotesia glomerata]